VSVILENGLYKCTNVDSLYIVQSLLLAMSVIVQQSSVALLIVWCLCYCHTAVSQEKVCSSFCSSLGMMESNPGKSCDDIYQINKASRGVSTNYWIQTSTGVHQVYCDMELECGGYKGGWMRIADLDISRGDNCPIGWRNMTIPDSASMVVCGSPSNNAGCYSTNFIVHGSSYYKICGKARGYQRSTPDAFRRVAGIKSINGPYVDGLSITVGSNRKHVWTYAVGIGGTHATSNCPCSSIVTSISPPAFVKTHYYCESGNTDGSESGPYYTNNPLWDGASCEDDNNNCCSYVAMPWFLRQFPVALQDNVEARICHDQSVSDEDIVIDLLQLFVQ